MQSVLRSVYVKLRNPEKEEEFTQDDETKECQILQPKPKILNINRENSIADIFSPQQIYTVTFALH